ncbi:MAG: hypothetical protein NT026_00420 [Candidatus Staskawiczbacteria bacterium]|nr:hypothetical protein [Candidatus Staskawiczbacteria bacterium]
MSKNMQKALIFLIIAGIIIFALGVWLGIFYAYKNPGVKNAQTVQPTINILSSKIVQTATAFGRVQKIDGNKITLTSQGDTATISVKTGAQIFSALAQKDPKSGNLVTGVPKPVSFADIKVGDAITITFKIDASGNLEGDQVFIFASNSAQ